MPNLNLKGTPPPKVTVPGAKPGAPPAAGGKKKILGLPLPIAISVAGVLGLGIVGLLLWVFGVFDEEKKQFPGMQFPTDTSSVADTTAAAVAAPTVALTAPGAAPKPAAVVERGRTTTPDTPSKKAPPPPPPPPPQGKRVAMGSGSYSIQISSWQTQIKASEQVSLFNNSGIPAFLSRAKGKDGRYRVYVGRYTSNREARIYAEKISPTLETGYSIVRISE